LPDAALRKKNFIRRFPNGHVIAHRPAIDDPFAAATIPGNA
jgi:hypothetical protein